MAALTAALVLPSEFKPSFYQPRSSQFVSRRRTKKTHPGFPVCVRVCVCVFFFCGICVLFSVVKSLDLIGSGGEAVWSGDFRSFKAEGSVFGSGREEAPREPS